MKVLPIVHWILEKSWQIILTEQDKYFGGEKVAKNSDVGRNGRKERDMRAFPEALIDSQKAEEALKQVKKRSENC